MTQKITKGCELPNNLSFNYCCFDRARDCFAALLDMLEMQSGDKILMPGYIGWSAREGSGVFDPIKVRSIVPVFYHLNERLVIDENDITWKINNSGVKLLLLIHYFGFPDKQAKQYADLAKKNGIIVIEDCAHALLTDLVLGGCGRWGDYSLFSLHKMLPMKTGGLLRVKSNFPVPKNENASTYEHFNYDFYSIANIRRHNYVLLDQIIRGASSSILSLFDNLPYNVVPQTYPIIITNSNRNKIYEYMNEKGWGVVSLYHTMIKEIDTDLFIEENRISGMIMNLPVHQDVNPNLYIDMIDDLVEATEIFKIGGIAKC